MKRNYPLVLSVVALLLTACGGGSSSVSSSQSSSQSSSSQSSSESSIPSSSSSSSSSQQAVVIDGVTFKPKTMKARLHAPDVTADVPAYFREDGMKNIPYLKLSDFYRCHVGKPLREVKPANGVFTVTSASGGVAVIDTVNDTLKSDDLEQFINTTIYRQEDAKNVYYDGAPFLRVKDSSSDVAPTPKNIEFKKDYGIDLFALENDVLLPVTTASNLFQGPTMLTCFYTTTDLFFIDPVSQDFSTETLVGDSEFRERLSAFFTNGKRSPEQADFSYGELCFFIDNYYGRPGRETLHTSLEEKGSLDAALAAHDDITRQARTWLKSTDQVEYYAGLYLLDDYLHDCGHTVLNMGAMMYINFDEHLYQAVEDKIASIGYTIRQNAAKGVESEYSDAYREARNAKGVVDKGSIVEGDTLLYTFDSFIFDIPGWADYYSHKIDEYPHDPIGEFKRVLEQYKDGQTIKNIVVDLSNNGGGSGDVVFTLIAMMGGKPYLNFYDFINKNVVHVDYEVDLNFDGKFDELDAAVTYPYRFGLLDSRISFSCGNLMPVQAKESGFLLLGDRSGGGACAVLDGVSAEGYYTRISSQIRLSGKGGEDVDKGVEPHVYLYQKTEESHDFSQFFDLGLMKTKMDEFYDGK